MTFDLGETQTGSQQLNVIMGFISLYQLAFALFVVVVIVCLSLSHDLNLNIVF